MDSQLIKKIGGVDGFKSGSVLTTDEEKNLVLRSNPLCFVVSQASHGYSIVNDVPIPVYVDQLTGRYEAAQANDLDTLKAAFVTRVIDINTIEIKVGQQIHEAVGHGLAIGEYYFLDSGTAGSFVNTKPINTISDVIFYIPDANRIFLIDDRPFDLESLVAPFMQASNIDATTDLNTLNVGVDSNAVFTEVPLIGSTEVNIPFFETVSNTRFRIPAGTPDQWYDIHLNMHCFSTTARTALRIRTVVNGSMVGPVAATGYIRDTAGHQESSYHLSSYSVFLSAGDEVSIGAQREANGNLVRLFTAGTSSFKIERRRK